jgi:hypothetical protein
MNTRQHSTFHSILGALALAGLLALTPLARADIAADLTRAEAGFMKAVVGAASPDLAVAAYAALTPDETAAPLVLAYLGAAQTLQGREAWLPWNKMRATERGLASIDKALRQLAPRHEETRLRGNPVAAETRLVAATTFLSVPDAIFHRADQGHGLLRKALAAPDFAALPPTLRARHHLQMAVAADKEKKTAEAAEQLRQCLAADASGPVAEDCRRRMKEPGA